MRATPSRAELNAPRMARSDSGSSRIEPTPSNHETNANIVNVFINISRRQLTLVTITILLHILLWSSLICIATSIYQVASDPRDTTNIAPVVLTTTSALATILYVGVHTTFSFRQRRCIYGRRHRFGDKKTTYVAVRIVVSLCVLWLMTSGWNMIIVARRPVCLQRAPGLQAWEYGPRCCASRVGITFAMFALASSCALFGIMATVRRPFEAHLFRCGDHERVELLPPPFRSRRKTHRRLPSHSFEEQALGHRSSVSTHRTAASNISATTLVTSNLDADIPSLTIHAPSPIPSVGLGIFTSNSTPPPIPSAYIALPRTSSLDTLSSVSYPSMSQHLLSRPPRLSGCAATPDFVPSPNPAQYSASTLRALHPSDSSSTRSAPRPHSQVSSRGFAYRSRYAQSSITLTRPRRLSSATATGSVDWSSLSGSTGPDGRSSRASGEDSVGSRASANEIVHAILMGTPIPGTTSASTRAFGHVLTPSQPDTTAGARDPHPSARMALGWKPQLTSTASPPSQRTEAAVPGAEVVPVKPVHSASAGCLTRFSPDIHPDDDDDDDEKRRRRELETALDAPSVTRTPLPVRRSWSDDGLRYADATVGARNPAAATMGAMDAAEAAAAKGSRTPRDMREAGGRGYAEKEDSPQRVKNKPLPRIAVV